jgi:hypothetical protein
MTSRTDRIEAAARAIMVDRHPIEWGKEDQAWDDYRGSFARKGWLREAELALTAAFPELMSDPPTGWVAPMEATPQMCSVGRRAVLDDIYGTEAKAAYEAIRDAHLKDNPS